MSSPLVILAVVFLCPLLVIYLLRINAALFAIALAVGVVLEQYGASQAARLAAHRSLGISLQLSLLLLPVVLTLLLKTHSVSKGKSKHNLILAIPVAALFGLLVVPILPTKWATAVVTGSYWHSLNTYRSLAVSLILLVSLVILLLAKNSTKEGKKSKSKD